MIEQHKSSEQVFTFRRKLLFTLIIFVAFLFLLEGGVRVFYLFENESIPTGMEYSEKLGWVVSADIKSINTFPGFGKVVYSTTTHGFRVFGDRYTEKLKILFLGDSYTQARKVSDGETFYDYIGQHTGAEIFAYGGGGYGSLQEYMILDKYFDLIRPDIVVWQFSPNDIHNNSFALESSSWKNNNHMTRPYYRDGTIKWMFPHSSWLYRNILRHSYLIKLFNIKLDILLVDNLGPIPSQLLTEDNPHFKEAANITAGIMRLVKARVKDTPVVAFSVSGSPRKALQNRTFSEISESLGFYYVDEVPKAIRKAAKAGVVVNGKPYDGHWNNTANSIAGKVMVDYLNEKNLLKAGSAD